MIRVAAKSVGPRASSRSEGLGAGGRAIRGRLGGG